MAYFNLADHDFINIYLSPLLEFKTFNGLNLNPYNEVAQLPTNIASLNLASSFINNFNIMYLLLVAELLIGLILFSLSKCCYYSLKIIGINLIKQGFLTLILFNCLNIAFSAGLHWKYATESDPSYILSSVALYIVLISVFIVFLCLEITSRNGYGEYKSKFKSDFVCFRN